jgi:predicted transposase
LARRFYRQPETAWLRGKCIESNACDHLSKVAPEYAFTLQEPEDTCNVKAEQRMDRTVRLRLNPTPEQSRVLADVVHQLTHVFNLVCAYAWGHGEKNSVKLHHATYRDARALDPALPSNLHIQARVEATETIKRRRLMSSVLT